MRRFASVGLTISDGLAFATGYVLFRYGANMPAMMLPPRRGVPNAADATDVYLILGVVFIAARWLSGDYTRRQLFWDDSRAVTKTLMLVAIPDAMLVLMTGGGQLYAPLALSWLFLVAAVPLYRQIARGMLDLAGLWQIPTALIGAGSSAKDVLPALRSSRALGFDLRWLMVDSPESAVPPNLSKLIWVFAFEPEEIADGLVEFGCERAVVAAEDMQSLRFAEIVHRLLEANIAVSIIPAMRRLPLIGISSGNFYGRDILLFDVRNNLKRFPYRLGKRAFDLAAATILLVLLSPLLALIAAAIALFDGNPILTRDERIGRGGRHFRMIGFRTTRDRAVASIENGEIEPPRTALGRWLKRTHLDKLPNLFNVLIGNMSMVGPAPARGSELHEVYGSAALLYRRVRPGITGAWLLVERGPGSNVERAAFDEWYILNWSLWHDVVILVQTLGELFGLKRRHSSAQQRKGMFTSP